MTEEQNGSEAGRQTIVLRGISESEFDWWADARRIDPTAFEGVEFVDVVRRRSGCCDVTVSVTEAAIEGLADGIETARGIAVRLRSALYEAASEVIENDYLRSEAEGIPECAAGTMFGPLTVVAEWTLLQALDVQFWIGQSTGDAACVELVRLGPPGDKCVTVAVAMPAIIFDAATSAYRQGGGKLALGDCVYDAISASYGSEPKPLREIANDHIPF